MIIFVDKEAKKLNTIKACDMKQNDTGLCKGLDVIFLRAYNKLVDLKSGDTYDIDLEHEVKLCDIEMRIIKKY